MIEPTHKSNIDAGAGSIEATSTGPALVVRHLVKRFGDSAVIDDVSFSIPGGSFLSLLGPSGSGKTTILRLIGGFESPDSGTIEIDGRELSALPPYRRDIGVVFQRYSLFPHLSVAENVAFPLKQRRVSRAACHARVEEILDAVGLPGYGNRRPAHLSGGQQQRVALARALVFKPRMLIMDEPLAALDKGLRECMQQEIRQLQRRLAITTLYITHDQSEAFAISDQVAVMHAGRIEQVDTPRALYESPQTAFVARFVGDSNLFCGVPSKVNGEAVLPLPDGSLLRYRPAPAQTERITLLVRPEKMQLIPGGETPAPGNRLNGRVLDVTFLGEMLHYRIESGGQLITVRQQNRAGVTSYAQGDDVIVTWAPSDTIVLR